MTRFSCKERTGDAVPRAKKFGDLITADHKLVNEDGESRNNRGVAFVVQDLATQWIESYLRFSLQQRSDILGATTTTRRNRDITETRLEEQKAQREDWFLRGRQIAHMIYAYFRVTGAHDAVLDYADLFTITLRSDNVQEFDTRWDEIILSMTKIPTDDVSESLYKLRIRESDQLKTLLELYDMELDQKISMPDCQHLKMMVKRSINQKLRLRNFDARNERIETGAVVTNRSGLSGVERGQGECYQWKASGQCSRGDSCSFRHDENKRAKPTPKTAPPSEPQTQRGRSTSRKKEPQKPESIWEVRSTAVQRLLDMYLHPITVSIL